MKIKITLIALIITAATAVQAQTSSEKYNAKDEMSTQMRLIVNGLGLQKEQIAELGHVMEAKRTQQESLLEEMDQLKTQMNQLELNTEKQIQGMLTPTEWKKYQEEIKPEIDKANTERMEKLNN